MKRTIISVLLVLLVSVITVGYTQPVHAQSDTSVAAQRAALLAQIQQLMAILEALLAEKQRATITNEANPIVTVVTNYGDIKLELFADVMPITTGNFIDLVQSDYYDNTQFHRVIDGFMIQGGDPLTKTDEVLRYGTGGPGYYIPDEHISHPKLTNVRGTLSMANAGPNTGGSQFFINLVDNTNLDFDKQPLVSQHPVFGKVVGGMNVVDAIGKVETNPADLPTEPVTVRDMEITNVQK